MEGPLSYDIDVSKGIAFIRYRAQPTFLEWSQTLEQLQNDTCCGQHFSILLDRTRICQPAETPYIRQMVRRLDRRREAGSEGRCAIVAGDEGSFGMGRMAEQLSVYENSIRTFRLIDKAEKWLETCDHEVCSRHGDPQEAPTGPKRNSDCLPYLL